MSRHCQMLKNLKFVLPYDGGVQVERVRVGLSADCVKPPSRSERCVANANSPYRQKIIKYLERVSR